jgi:hypothetical protein
LTGWDSILVFPLWLKNLNISSFVYWPFVLLLRTVCSIHLFTY